MLEELYLENVVLFAKGTLRFTRGFNVISGETGAGKSLLAQGLSLALGQRANAEWIRAGEEEAVTSAVFCLETDQLPPELETLGITPDEDGRLIFERHIRRDGPSRQTLNGRPISGAVARQAMAVLMDVSAQNEQTRLMEPAYQRSILDRYGHLKKDVETFAALFSQATRLQERLRADDAGRAKAKRRLEEIHEDLERLEKAAYDPASDADLEMRIQTLSHAEAIRELAERAVSVLYEEEDSVQDRLAVLARETEDLATSVASLRECADALENATSLLDDAVRGYRDALTLDGSPEELEMAIERAEMLKRLAKRFDCEVAELPDVEARLRAEEAELTDWDVDSATVKKALAEALKNLETAGLALRKKRAKAGKTLATAVDRELVALGMEQAGFTVELRPVWSSGDDPQAMLARGTTQGLDDVEFCLSPNPGEAASSLSATASGGEAARAMLAIKAALSEVYAPPVLFFDEIDAGIGSRLGDVVGRKLRDLSQKRQVITITHLPQIAAMGNRHLKVTKNVQKKRTLAQVEELDGENRVEEIAQMIRGDASTSTTRKQAEEMLLQN